ncbi:MAG TPA: hypothetical protein VNH44_11075, partial [Micropepsaceae bacterium]|nr:hypothetical protein [Micropepsaceae bacterium]
MSKISHRWAHWFGGLIVAAFCMAGPASAQAPARISIAVLPFEYPESSQDYFAGGLTDEIAAALTGVRGLDVVARSSSFRLPPTARDSKSIGQSLNAAYLVRGNTRLVGDRVRISAWLVRAEDGVQLWSENYYAELPNIFDLEEDIAEKIAGALHVPTGLQNGDLLVHNR